MIDLHIHSEYSNDGSEKIIDILKMAENLKLEVISITDHDIVDGYEELETINIKEYFSGKLIKGVEITCVFDGKKIEALAYDYDIKKLEPWIDANYNSDMRKKRTEIQFNLMVKKAKKAGIKLEKDLQLSYTKYSPFEDIRQSAEKFPDNETLFINGSFRDGLKFYREATSNPDFCLFIDYNEVFPSLSEVSKIVRKSDGKIFLAHLFQYKIVNHLDFLEKIVKNNLLDGIECFYSSFNSGQSDILLSFASKNNLLVSGGTDFHGKERPDIKLGIGKGNMNISKEIIENWS